ncbi:hypothetical protein KI387_014781, partial [Taxus chinensis]
KETTGRKRRKLRLNEEVDESAKSMLGSPIQPEDVEETRDEDIKDKEEGGKE